MGYYDAMKKLIALLCCLFLGSSVFAGIPGAVYMPSAGVNTVGTLPVNCGGLGNTVGFPSGLVVNNCRTYLVSGSPYADGSSSGNATVYFGPCSNLGKFLTLDNGSGVLSVFTVSEISKSLSSGFSSATIYDEYVYNNSGTLTIDTTAWSSNTPPTRGTDAAGRLTKTGATNELLVGAFYMISSTATADWYGERLVSNVYNTTSKNLQAADSTGSWSYNGVARPADNNTTDGVGRFSVLQVLAINSLVYSTFGFLGIPSGSIQGYIGIGLNSTSSLLTYIGANSTTAVAYTSTISYSYSIASSSLLGYNYIQRLESTASSGSVTYYGAGESGASAMINN